jgi:hypothetical protein
MSEHHPEQRAYYRLRYPEAERPTMRIGDQNYAVTEISQAGVRILLTGNFPVEPGQPFTGSLRFRDGETVLVRGAVLRIGEREAALQVLAGVSARRMMAEQRRLLRNYLNRFWRPGPGPDAGPA